jgi:hypothetical protein
MINSLSDTQYLAYYTEIMLKMNQQTFKVPTLFYSYFLINGAGLLPEVQKHSIPAKNGRRRS